MTKFNKGYEDLLVWQKAIALAEEIYMATKKFPKEEMFGMVSQMRRSGISIASNIAEGCARSGSREFMHFLSISSGSAAELKTQTVICERVGLLQKTAADTLLLQINEIERMLAGLMKSVEKPATRNLQLAT